MKLNPKALRYMTADEFRTLTAVEMGMKNHEVVPTPLITNIANLRGGGVHKHIAELARINLIARVQNTKYDGYRLTYGGYDFLALRAFSNRGTVTSVGYQIGVGKESDVFIVANAEGEQRVLKIQRLGRVSFRNIKNKRDYLQKRKSASWMYMSRLASMKEFAFMKVLHQHGFPVPCPIDQNRHQVVMELIQGYPLQQVTELAEPGRLYAKLMDLIVRLAKCGLIHGDFNEFNLMIKKNGDPVLIDFPQMVSTSHKNAEYYFDRDVDCIRAFFRKRFGYETKLYPKFSQVVNDRDMDLDLEVNASGFTKKQQEDFEDLVNDLGEENDDCDSGDESEEIVYESSEEEEEYQEETLAEEEGKIIAAMENVSVDNAAHDNDSIAESEYGEELENGNHQYQPFRDDLNDSIVQPSMSPAEIKERLKKSKQGGGSKYRRPSARNMTKNHGKAKGNKVSYKDHGF